LTRILKILLIKVLKTIEHTPLDKKIANIDLHLRSQKVKKQNLKLNFFQYGTKYSKQNKSDA
jgi:hypothetical protein